MKHFCCSISVLELEDTTCQNVLNRHVSNVLIKVGLLKGIKRIKLGMVEGSISG